MTKRRPSLRRTGIALLATVMVAGVAGALGAPLPAAAGQTNLVAPVLTWAYTDSVNKHTTYANPTTDVPLGGWLDQAGTTHLSRIYATFDVSAFSGKHILEANLYAQESQATDCQDRAIEIWTTGDAPHPTWDNPPRERDLIGTIGGTTACPGTLAVDLTSAITDAAAAHKSTINLEIRVPAAHETDVNLGRWLSHFYGLRLSVGYNTRPLVPTDMYNTYLPCGDSGDAHPYLGLQPGLLARFTDPDASDTLTAEFRIWPVDHPEQSTVLSQRIFRSGFVSGVGVPAGLLADGTRYAWQTRLGDGTDISGWSHTCYFTTDGSRPAAAPGVVSSNYPSNGDWVPGGTPAHFTFSANGVSDVAGYVFGWNDLPVVGGYSTGPDGAPIWTDPLDGPGAVRASQLGGTATVDLSPPHVGINRLSVESVDRAYNVSPVTTYEILVQDTAPTVTLTSPVGGPGQPLTLKFTPNPSLNAVDSYTYQVNVDNPVTVPAGPDGTASVSVTPTTFGQLSVRVTSHSPNGWVSPEKFWSVDISNAPRVGSDVYPPLDDTGSGPAGGGLGVPGTFTLTAGLPGSTTFFYSVDWGDAVSLPVGPDGTATFTWTPDVSGYHEIEVYSVDANGGSSDFNFYEFLVADPS